MGLCNVLRCDQTVTRAVNLAPPDYPVLEWGVCDAHGQALDAGEPRRVDPELGAHVIYVGSDIKSAGEVLVTKFEGVSDDLSTMAAGKPTGATVTRLRMTDELGDPFSFLITEDALRRIVRTAVNIMGIDPGGNG